MKLNCSTCNWHHPETCRLCKQEQARDEAAEAKAVAVSIYPDVDVRDIRTFPKLGVDKMLLDESEN